MVWLPDGEKNLKIRLFVLTEFTNVTDRRTDGQRDRHRMTATFWDLKRYEKEAGAAGHDKLKNVR